MLNQNDVREKLQGLKGNLQTFIHKLKPGSETKATAQADGVRDDSYEFTPVEDEEEEIVDHRLEPAPKATSILSDGSSDAHSLVWENEEASMQDKSYAFDEESTDADYDFEDDLEFEDESDTGSGQESRYR